MTRPKKKPVVFTLVCASLLLAVVCHAQDDREQESSQQKTAGYEEDYFFVRDAIFLQAYSGVLKGANGTERDGSGNSLDKAIVLFTRLQEKGFAPKIAFGRLRGDNLDKIINYSLGIVTTEEYEAPQLNPLAVNTLRDIMADHYWVQLPLENEAWLNLDPSLPETPAGSTLANFRRQLIRIPSHLYQRLEIRVTADFSIGGERARSRLLRHIASVKDLITEPMYLLFLNKELDGSFTYNESDRFYPLLLVNGNAQPALNLKSEANRIATQKGGIVLPVQIHSIWIEYTFKIPGRADMKVRRVLFSENNPQNSHLDEMIIISLRTGPMDDAKTQYHIERLHSDAVKAHSFLRPTFTQAITASEQQAADEFFLVQKNFGDSLATLLHLLIERMENCLDISLETTKGVILPRLLTISIDPVSAGISTDVLLIDSPRAVWLENDIPAIAANFALGVGASFLEGFMLQALSQQSVRDYGQNTHVVATRDSVLLTKRAIDSGISWQAIDSSSIVKLDDYGSNPGLLRRLESALKNEKILVLPSPQSYQRMTPEEIVWWELDSNTGSVTGMIGMGIGGARLGAFQEEDIVSGIAGSYVPLYSEGWGSRLSQHCQTVANLLKSASGSGIYMLPPDLGDSILAIYDLLYSAIEKADKIILSTALREFFSDSGRKILNGAAGRFCYPPALEIIE